MSVQSVWPDKVQYSISIPSKAVVFGTCIPVDIVLVPMLKGLTIGKVVCALREIHTFACIPRTSPKIDTRHIATQTFETGAMEEDSEGELGRWVMHDHMVLPKSLNACVQDCEVPSIKIRHKWASPGLRSGGGGVEAGLTCELRLKFTVQLHNPDGHMSELRASLPVMLFISPNYLMDDTNRIPSDTAAADAGSLTNAPPRYDEHYLDRLYENVRHDSFDTPLPSGANTPMPLSRNASSDNLGSLANGHVEPIPLPDASSRRWMVGSSSVHGLPSETDHSAPQTRTPSPPLLATPPPPMEDLTRVPSYTTAVRTGTRNLSNAAPLPLYDECNGTVAVDDRSAPVSPQNSPPGMSHMFSSRPRVTSRNSARSSTGSAGGILRRSHSSHHLHSLSDLLEGLRG